jgi:hypothetical protein
MNTQPKPPTIEAGGCLIPGPLTPFTDQDWQSSLCDANVRAQRQKDEDADENLRLLLRLEAQRRRYAREDRNNDIKGAVILCGAVGAIVWFLWRYVL